jgi:hypothetical protein
MVFENSDESEGKLIRHSSVMDEVDMQGGME